MQSGNGKNCVPPDASVSVMNVLSPLTGVDDAGQLSRPGKREAAFLGKATNWAYRRASRWLGRL